MTHSIQHIGIGCIALVFLGAMTSTAGAGIKPGGDLSNKFWINPPKLHSNQGGRSHGGGPAIVILSRPEVGFGDQSIGSLVENAIAFTIGEAPTEAVPGTLITMPGEGDHLPMSSTLFAEDGSMSNGNMVPGPGSLVLLLTAGLGMQRRRRRF